MANKPLKLETLAVHAGRAVDRATGAVTTPIHLSTTFERSAEGEYPRGFSYAREDNPNRRSLEECLAALEGGNEGIVLSSGLAVVAAVVQGLEPGDHILAPDDVYYGLRKVVHEVFGKWLLEIDYVDMADMAVVRSKMRPNTRVIWIETPSNPLLKITDVSAMAALGRERNAITICDATFASPALLQPLAHGIDMVMHSTTKYLGGHSDVMGGSLVTKHPNYLFERVRKSQRFGGSVPSAFDCWLTLRGISTLPWRMRAHSENALRVASFLQSHPRVERVHYPGLRSHPQYELAARQMTGAGGMLSFQVRGGKEEALRVAAKVRTITRATSLGGPHTLIEHRASIEGPQTRTPENLLRMSVGLEHPDDLIADVTQALA